MLCIFKNVTFKKDLKYKNYNLYNIIWFQSPKSISNTLNIPITNSESKVCPLKRHVRTSFYPKQSKVKAFLKIFKKDLKYFCSQKMCILKEITFKKDLKYKINIVKILRDASHQEVLLHERSPCVCTSIRCPCNSCSSRIKAIGDHVNVWALSIYVFGNGIRFKVNILKRFKILF